MNARDLFALVRDLRDVGIPYEPEPRLPVPVRHETALYVALGYLVDRGEDMPRTPLYQRTLAALRWIGALGARSRWASWFGVRVLDREAATPPAPAIDTRMGSVERAVVRRRAAT